MEDYIRKIFEIDDQAEKTKKEVEDKKNELLKERESMKKKLDDQYLSVLEEEKNNLELRLKQVEQQDKEKLESYQKKADDTKAYFESVKGRLIDEIAESLLESGD